MYRLEMDGGMGLVVRGRHEFRYSVDGSMPNPLEAVIAAIAACAGVYILKACTGFGVSAGGIVVEVVPRRDLQEVWSIFGLNAFETRVSFPDGFREDLVDRVLESVEACAVKELIKNGGKVNFSVVRGFNA